MELRNYQKEAVISAWNWIETRDDNPCIVIPTGGGKTPIIAALCDEIVQSRGRRALIVSHVKELLEQTLDKIGLFTPELIEKTGVYSAGLNRRETEAEIVIAGIQSAYSQAEKFGSRDLVIVDEAHMIPPEGDGMYRTFFSGLRAINPKLRIIGLTATPFRTSSGLICSPENILNGICYEIGIRDLIRDGYLCSVRGKSSRTNADLSEVRVKAGEFVANELEKIMSDRGLVKSSCDEILNYTKDRRKTLIFTSGIEHGLLVQEELKNVHNVDCGFVCGDLRSDPREETLERFRNGELKYLVNVNVLTTGFDEPGIDCVSILRPTLSPGLFYQMVGRGFRVDPGKKDCLILDFGGNALRHGPIDAINSVSNGFNRKNAAKKCPECMEILHAETVICPSCGYILIRAKTEHDSTINEPKKIAKQDANASEVPILSGAPTETTYEVTKITYEIHYKRNAGPNDPRTLEVKYETGFFSKPQREYICFEHKGFAREKAVKWWARRTTAPVPNSIEEAIDYINAGALVEPTEITVRVVAIQPFPRIVRIKMDPPRQFDQILTNEFDVSPRDDFNVDEEKIPLNFFVKLDSNEVPF